MNDDGLQIRASRFDSGRRLHCDSNPTNAFLGSSQPPITTQPPEPGDKPGDSDWGQLSRRERAVLIIVCVIAMLGTATYILSVADHTRETIRYHLIWLATGERPDMPGD